jgi:hypothetical protein
MSEISQIKLQSVFWDVPEEFRTKYVKTLLEKNEEILYNEQVILRLLNSLSWYELISLIGFDNLKRIVNSTVIKKLFPESRRNFYIDAQRLLSKYTVSFTR